jgi:signal peptidase I
MLAAFIALVLSIPWTRIVGVGAAVALRLLIVVDAGWSSARPARRRIWSTIAVFVAGLVASVGLWLFWIGAFKVPAGSMVPTIEVGDHMYIAKWQSRLQRGDIIVFRYPKDPERAFVKRVVAMAGDRVFVRRGDLYLNGEKVPTERVGDVTYWDHDERSDTWVKREAVRFDEKLDGRTHGILHDSRPVEETGGSLRGDFWDLHDGYTVPPGAVFVLGDNRDNSHDSRYFGPVPLDNVIGRPLFVWWSSGPEGIRWGRIGKALDR